MLSSFPGCWAPNYTSADVRLSSTPQRTCTVVLLQPLAQRLGVGLVSRARQYFALYNIIYHPQNFSEQPVTPSVGVGRDSSNFLSSKCLLKELPRKFTPSKHTHYTWTIVGSGEGEQDHGRGESCTCRKDKMQLQQVIVQGRVLACFQDRVSGRQWFVLLVGTCCNVCIPTSLKLLHTTWPSCSLCQMWW